MSALDILRQMIVGGVSHIEAQLMRQPLHEDFVVMGMAFTMLGVFTITEKAAQRVLPSPFSMLRILGCGLLGAAAYAGLISIGFAPTLMGALIGACLGFGLHFTLALALAPFPTGEKSALVFVVGRLLVGALTAILLTAALVIVLVLYWVFAHTIQPLLHGLVKVIIVVGMVVVFVVVSVVGLIFWGAREWRPSQGDRSVLGATASAPFNGKIITAIVILWAMLVSKEFPPKYKRPLGDAAFTMLVFVFLGGSIATMALLAAIIVDVVFGRVVGAASRPLLINGVAGRELITPPINPTAYTLLFAIVVGLLIGGATVFVQKIGLLSASRFLVGFVAGLALGPFSGLGGAGAWALTTVGVIALCLGVWWLAERTKARQALFGVALTCLGALLFMLPYVGPLR